MTETSNVGGVVTRAGEDIRAWQQMETDSRAAEKRMNDAWAEYCRCKNDYERLDRETSEAFKKAFPSWA